MADLSTFVLPDTASRVLLAQAGQPRQLVSGRLSAVLPVADGNMAAPLSHLA